MRTTDTAVREVVERAIELARRYAVWWQLSTKETFAQNEAVVNDHEDYFTTTTHALFESFMVITYQLYERRKDTISIPSLIAALKSSDRTLAADLAAMMDRNKHLLAKAFAIRCGIYAHRSKKQAPEAIFADAGITAREMGAIVRMTTNVVGALAEAAGVDTKQEIVEEIERRGTCAGDDTMLLMSALREHAV